MEKKYKNLDHTGDLKIEAIGDTLEELIEQASLALTDTMVEVSSVLPKQEAEWSITGEALEEILVNHLQEILYRFDTEGMVFSKFQIRFPEARILYCLAYGEPLDREKHGFKTELKAVTYHRLFIGQEQGRWVTRVVLDV